MVKPIEDSIRRVDAVAKASGSQKYLCDLYPEGVLNVRVVRSTIPRGKIINIEIPDLPEGYWYISDKDIPECGKNELWMIQKDWKCFAGDEVRFVGETIGLLCGEDMDVLIDLEKKVKIEYQEMEAATTIEDALACRGGAFVGDDNIHCQLHLSTADGKTFDEIAATADHIYEDEIETGFQEHVHLETNSAMATIENGKFTIYASCQCPFYIRKSTAGLLGLKPEDIVVKQTMTGGAFGGKENFPDVLAGPLLVACNRIRRPVKLVHSREDDNCYSVKRHPAKIKFRTALDKNGDILAIEQKIYYNAGGYLSSSFVVVQRGAFHADGCYLIPNTFIDAYGVATNTFPSDAFRGFGAPQTLFAIEQHMNHLAKLAGVDPLDYKRRYWIKQGDRTVTNGHIVEKVVIPEMVEQVITASDYYRKSREYGYGSGKGIGISFYNHGAPFTGNGERDLINAHVTLHKYPDGKVEILCGQTEMGQGYFTTARKILAHALDIPFEMTIYDNPDTSRVPDSGPSAASRSIMVPGYLIEKAAKKMKERYDKEDEFEITEAYEHPDGHPWDQATFQGDAYLGYGWGVAVVEVEVDPLTSEVTTKGIWSSHDIGHPIDLQIVHGQINGGIIQSLGYAAMEKMDNVNGVFRQKSLSDYIIPSSMDFPKMEWFLVDNPYPWGPSGAKGMGELVFNGASAAYVDAVARAIDRKIQSIPIPPEKIRELEIHGSKN